MKMPWEEAGITEEQYYQAVEEEYLDQLERVEEALNKREQQAEDGYIEFAEELRYFNGEDEE